jgi:hypothetical protein
MARQPGKFNKVGPDRKVYSIRAKRARQVGLGCQGKAGWDMQSALGSHGYGGLRRQGFAVLGMTRNGYAETTRQE